MIEKMTKYSFILLSSYSEEFLQKLQQIGMMDITRSRKPVDAKSSALLDRMKDCKDTVAYLKKADYSKAADSGLISKAADAASLPHDADPVAFVHTLKERLESLIDEFNLHKVRKSLGIQLSGGERRRCEIARALAIDPKFILLDEPFAGVDPIAVEDIQYIIAKLKYKNIGVIITDHNVGETLAIIDRAYLLYEGNILQSGTPEALAADDEVRTKYLGSNFILKRSSAFDRAQTEHDTKERETV